MEAADVVWGRSRCAFKQEWLHITVAVIVVHRSDGFVDGEEVSVDTVVPICG